MDLETIALTLLGFPAVVLLVGCHLLPSHNLTSFQVHDMPTQEDIEAVLPKWIKR